MRLRKYGFTLIELLIVVAIIAILAAIAVPNFLEAQTRAKVSRVKADMRSMATAVETYAIDWNMYLYQNRQSRALAQNDPVDRVFERVTTPIAYLAGVDSFRSPFRATRRFAGNTLQNDEVIPEAQLDAAQIYWYAARNNGNSSGTGSAQWGRTDPRPNWFFTQSAGPTGRQYGLNDVTRAGNMDDNDAGRRLSSAIMYNATNGTMSHGGIFRVGGSSTPLAKALYNAITYAQ